MTSQDPRAQHNLDKSTGSSRGRSSRNVGLEARIPGKAQSLQAAHGVRLLLRQRDGPLRHCTHTVYGQGLGHRTRLVPGQCHYP